MDSPQYTLSDTKDKEKLLAAWKEQRGKQYREELLKKLKNICMSELFGWGDRALQLDISLGVDRLDYLLDCLEQVQIIIKEEYRKHGSGTRRSE